MVGREAAYNATSPKIETDVPSSRSPAEDDRYFKALTGGKAEGLGGCRRAAVVEVLGDDSPLLDAGIVSAFQAATAAVGLDSRFGEALHQAFFIICLVRLSNVDHHSL